jgi:hypothetical protein
MKKYFIAIACSIISIGIFLLLGFYQCGAVDWIRNIVWLFAVLSIGVTIIIQNRILSKIISPRLSISIEIFCWTIITILSYLFGQAMYDAPANLKEFFTFGC